MSGINDFLDQTSREEAIEGAPRQAIQESDVTNWLSDSHDKAKLGLSVKDGFQRDSQRSSRILKLQAKTGLPEDLVDRNLDEIEKQSQQADFNVDKFWTQSPIVAKWISENPNHASVAKEDISKLSYLERQIKHISQQYDQGNQTVELSKIGESAFLGNITPGQRRRQMEIEHQMSTQVDYGIDSFAEKIPGYMANQVPIFGSMIFGQAKGAAVGAACGAGAALVAGQLGPQVAVPEEIATVPAGALAGGFVGWRYGAAVEAARLEASLAYLDFEKIKDEQGNPLGRGAAVGAATVVGAINGGLESVGLSTITRTVPGLRNLTRGGMRTVLKNPSVRRAITQYTKNVGLSMTGEGVTEFLQEIVKISGQELLQMHQNGELESASSTDIVSRIFSDDNLNAAIESGKAGAGAGGGITAVTSTASIGQDIAKVRKAKRMQQAFSDIGNGVQDMKILESLPEKSQEVIQRISESGPVDTVYAPLDTWNEYWQSKGLDPNQAAAEVLGVDGAEIYAEAVQTGSDIAIPMSKYASVIAPSEHHEFFQSEIKSDPLDMNAREADEFIRQMDEQDVQIAEELQKTEEQIRAEEQKAQIQEQVTAQLEEAGFDQQTAQTYSQILEQGFGALSERSGVDAGELFGQYDLEITRPEIKEEEILTGEQVYNQSKPSRTILFPVKAKGNSLSVDAAEGMNASASVSEKGMVINGLNYNPKYLGVAQDMIRSLEKTALARGLKTMLATTKDEKVIAAYEAQGFKAQQAGDTTVLTKDLSDELAVQQLHQDKRGRIKFNDKRKFNIELLKDADLSTFLHETGHFYLEVLGDLAIKEGASTEIVRDYNTVLNWLGVESREAIGVEQHEKWARGFEAYLLEGKAPSSQLRAAFAKFRAWLSSIYKKMTALDVELSNDIRSVMDRMLATDRELEEARNEQNLAPLFGELATAGFNEQQALAYSESILGAQQAAQQEMLGKYMDQIKREKKKWWREEAAKVRSEVEQEIGQEKEYIALANMQRGTLPDGTELPSGVNQIKLNRQALVEEFGAETVKNELPKPHIYTREGGVHQDVAADIFGFSTGKEMVESLVRATPRKQEIANRVNKIMKERHGDLLNDGSAKEEAMNVIHNDKTAQLMRKELEHLASNDFAKFKGLVRKINRPIPKVDFVRKQAEGIIARKKIRDIRPIVYRRAESKAARMAQDFFLQGDFVKAFDEKQKQLLNHELYRAATIAKESAEKVVDYMNKFQKKSTRERIGKAGGTYLEQIDSILERFSFKRATLKSLDRQQSLLAWMQEQQALGFTVDIPEKLLNEALRQNYRETSYYELIGIRDSVKNIEHLARVKNRLLANKKTKDIEAAEADIIASIQAFHKIKDDPPDFTPDFKSRVKEKARGFLAAHTKMEFLFEHLDGNEANGAAWRNLFKPFADAENVENNMMRDVTRNMRDIFSAYSKSERALWYYKKEFIPEINTSMNKANMLSVALNWGNQYNRSALLEGYGWSEGQVQAILNKLDKRDWETVQKIWDYIDTFWPQIEAQEKDLNGIAPPKVEVSEVETSYGTFKGGYYPIIFDSKLSWRQAKIEGAETVKEMFGGNWARAMTKHGHTKERVGTGGKPIKLELSGLTDHVSAVVHDLSHRKAVVDVSMLVERKAIREAIESSVGREMYRQIKPWIAGIAGDRRTEPSNPVEGLLNKARTGATIVTMGWKFTTAIVQFTGYAVSTKELGGKYALQGLKEALQNPLKIKENYRFISDRSPFMRYRLGNYDRDIRDFLKKLNVAGTKQGVFGVVDAYTNELRDSWFSMIGYMDLAVSMPTWMGAYRKAMDGKVSNIKKGDEQAAIDFADSLVRKTQGAGAAKDLALVQRGNEAFKLFTMFYSYFSVQFNQFQKTTNQFRLDKNIPKLVGSMALLWFAPAVIEDFILGRGPDEDADEEEWTKWFIKKEVTYPFQGIILLRDIVNGADKYGYSPSAAFDAYNSMSGMIKLGGKFAAGEKDDIERKDIKSVFMTTGYLTGLPSRQIWLSSEYFYDWMTGEESPDNPVEGLWRGLVTGKPKE